MEILLICALLIGGALLLSWGANFFVGSASRIAKRLGVPSIVIGLTVVAFGTSAPEMAVNVIAALNGNSGIAMGNVVGSNIFNVCVILGVCSVITPIAVNMQLMKIDIPIMLAASLGLILLTRDLSISRYEGLLFVVGFILYNFLQVKLAMKERSSVKKEYEEEFREKGNLFKDSLVLVAGLCLLVLGADLFVEGAVKGARLLGWSESLIGLTIIAAGTSLPEVAASVAATLKGERDIAVGNVVGSNIFNILSVLGISGTITNLSVSAHMASIDTYFMLIVSALMFPLAFRNQIIGRAGGLLLICLWSGYTAYLVIYS